MESSSWSVSKPLAVGACVGMAVTYVGLLYAPRFILRLSPPSSFNQYMIRRFSSAAVASIFALLLSFFLLFPVWDFGKAHMTSILDAYGLRLDHLWQAIFFPLILTALLYLGPLVTAALEFIDKWKQEQLQFGWGAVECGTLCMRFNILTWRNYIVAPLTEELVFRACMIPLLLCGGFQPYAIVFLCPLFFSLAHLNHFWEFYYQQNYTIGRAALVVGLQLGYTVIFGWYASFLFIRTGHLVAPLVAHIFCNFMGLPSMSCIQRGKGEKTVYIAYNSDKYVTKTPTIMIATGENISRCSS